MIVLLLASLCSAISDYQERMERIKRLRAEIESESTRPVSDSEVPAAPGSLSYVHLMASDIVANLV